MITPQPDLTFAAIRPATISPISPDQTISPPTISPATIRPATISPISPDQTVSPAAIRPATEVVEVRQGSVTENQH